MKRSTEPFYIHGESRMGLHAIMRFLVFRLGANYIAKMQRQFHLVFLCARLIVSKGGT